MSRERHVQLSESGQMRREAMLGELLDAMHAHHHERRLRRNVAMGGAAALLILSTVYFVASAGTVGPAPLQEVAARPSIAEDPVAVRITRVETQPGIADRYRSAVTSTAVRLDDTELLATLRAADRPAGLVRMGEEVFLTASVIDQPTDAARPNSL